jgi:hypothetical protein
MGKGSKRRPEDAAKLARNWPRAFPKWEYDPWQCSLAEYDEWDAGEASGYFFICHHSANDYECHEDSCPLNPHTAEGAA